MSDDEKNKKSGKKRTNLSEEIKKKAKGLAKKAARADDKKPKR